MSCTVVAVPYALMWVVGAIATAAASASVGMHDADSITTTEDVFDFNKNQTKECEDTHIITEKHFIEKIFETPFMDKLILSKTLEEHGVKNIIEWESIMNGIALVKKVLYIKITDEEIKKRLDDDYKLKQTINEKLEKQINIYNDNIISLTEKYKNENLLIEIDGMKRNCYTYDDYNDKDEKTQTFCRCINF